MRYCRLETPTGPRYASIEDRDGAPWATVLIAAPPESRVAYDPAEAFIPVALAEATLLAPVEPSKIVCVGRNYREHAAELGNEVPAEPLLFFKPPSSLLAPGAAIRLPEQSSRVDFEGELAVVVGRQARALKADTDLRPYIRGYTIVNDVTARDLQKKDGQWTRAKGFDTFCPCGPIVSSEVNPAAGLTLETRLNGERKQYGTTRDFIFLIPHLLVYITAFMTLEPGDLIPTGTPAGVGPMAAGDTVEVEIEGLGVLKNSVE
ncbi:MAG TPA: fumarylacetoacetate hydrolase family protein [Acidobacteriaceae bacterium]|jgi:2-keto-4-pentenoate hydratase/2-oxohepta-3-ene-1,7-dioic acid hydratase in catechol pathway